MKNTAMYGLTATRAGFRLPRNLCRVLVLLLVAFSARQVGAQQKPFDLHGTYIEGCSCSIACVCDFTSMAKGCQVMGATIISTGTFGDADLSGAKMAYVVGGKWVRIYVQSKDPAQFKAAGALGRALFGSYGKIESVRSAKIDVSGTNGSLTLLVDGGKVIRLKTQPVLGGDKKTAVTYTNYPDPLYPTVMQGKTVSGSYNDGTRHFTLKGSNAFFNQDWNTSGKL